ncbi:MAG TPA: hypothetical protein VFP80_18205 [Thermoanaerobaculia bacterium]|nr:hypothetical protein [Thermoanaerobaculia bacterium]
MKVRLLTAALLLFSLPLLGSEPLAVVEPANGTVLRGGSIATIAWTATAPLPPDVEEWEAFLSVDGGHYYATRITPHLDIDIRSFEWRVPNVASNDVRLLIRIGDEREETEVDVPLRLSIVADPLVRLPVAHVAASTGESARPGDPGVAVWVEGDRKGHELVLESAPVCASFGRTSTYSANAFRHGAAVQPAVAVSHRTLFSISAIAAVPRARTAAPALARDILLLVRRRNI